MEVLFDIIFLFCIASIFFINIFLLKQVREIKSNVMDLKIYQSNFREQFGFHTKDTLREMQDLVQTTEALKSSVNELKSNLEVALPNKNVNNWENISRAFARSGRGTDVRD